MIDIMAIRQSYERRELQEVRWINGDDNPADAMTKTKPNLSLETFINTNKLDIRVEGWVKRDGPVFTDRQNSDESPEQEGECGQAVKRFESVFERILTSIRYSLCHMTFGLLFTVLTEEKLKAYWSARPVEAMASTKGRRNSISSFSWLLDCFQSKEKLPVSRMRNHLAGSLKPAGFKLRGLIPHLFLRLFQLLDDQSRIYLCYQKPRCATCETNILLVELLVGCCQWGPL